MGLLLRPFFIVWLYIRGLWFLLSSPIEFYAFVKEWERYKVSIAENDAIAESGFYHLPRSVRRSKKLKRVARLHK